jgi:wyosine [tRNA(Phe)-imidazoG37] synthetase (radical SAM superfamily)
VRDLRHLRDRLAPDLPVAILSNSATLDRAPIRKALAELDERHMKLDAGDDVTRRRLNGSAVEAGRIVAGLKGLSDIFVQSMFVGDRQGRLDNTGHEAVSNWLAWLAEIRPRGVHIYTIDRQPAFPFLRAVALDRLDAIAQRVRQADIPAQTFA